MNNNRFFLFLTFLLFTTIIITYFQNFCYAQYISDSVWLKADAGKDQFSEEGKQVILNAENTRSSDLPIDSYSWVQVEPKNPLLQIKNSNTSKASFLSPNLPYDSNFVLQLIVKDGNITDLDLVNIFIAEDLNSINKVKNISEGSYQPEQCSDGSDNDLDGKIDIQDEECNLKIIATTTEVVPEFETSHDEPFQNEVTERPQQQPGQMQPDLVGPDGQQGAGNQAYRQAVQSQPPQAVQSQPPQR